MNRQTFDVARFQYLEEPDFRENCAAEFERMQEDVSGRGSRNIVFIPAPLPPSL